MIRRVPIDELRRHLESAKDRLAEEKGNILDLHLLPDTFNKSKYAFLYVRAERTGLRAINKRLAEIAWLPMQLDPRTEMLTEGRDSMKRWLMSALAGTPTSEKFGNDFIHAVTRCGLLYGEKDGETIGLIVRIADLFRDLSCLIGLLYYCSWLTENEIGAVPLTEPEALNRSAEEIAAFIQSPEIHRWTRERLEEKRMRAKLLDAARTPRAKPILRVVNNPAFTDGFAPDPAMA
jgi:hypothetical protein